ncbi:MAG TPA: hypothetical protein VI757_10860 [Bacteroidia bacterium]|nr:hypothetical protein [Bacteroidia bacterium]
MKKIFLSYVTCFSFAFGFAQDKAEQFEKAKQLRADDKFDEALTAFQSLLNNDSSNIEYLHHTAYLLCKMGNRKKEETERQKYFRQAEYLSKKAIAINSNSADAHYTYALALGRISENAGSKQKISNAKVIKAEGERTVILNPKHAGAYHLLGRWHRTVAGFNTLEKILINTLFGGVPEGGSYDKAIECFAKAVENEPGYILHIYELAVSYYDRGNANDDVYAMAWLKKAITMPLRSEDDKVTLSRCNDLLKKLK